MRELSEQEIESVSGGSSAFSVGLGPLSATTIGQGFQFYEPIVLPPLNIVEDFFKNNPDS
jgi:hypothetical protein